MAKDDKATPKKWHEAYRNDEEKCVFVGKDGCSGLIRKTDKNTGKKFEWRSTDALATESGLSKKRVEEILEHYCNKGVVRQHSKDPEKWGYWEVVGQEKADPDVVAKDHENRMDKQNQINGKKPATTKPAAPGGASSTTTPAPAKAPAAPAKAPSAPAKAPATPAKTLPAKAPVKKAPANP